jgi:hypothetical protein
MISIIICSVTPSRVEAVTKNIASTIGVPHEVIIINNAKELGGMGAGYNTGAEKAVYDICCFVHDDVEFYTKDWGENVIAHFEEDADLALIGLAGSRYKSKTLSGWNTRLKQSDCCNIYQRNRKGKDRHDLMRPDGMNGKSIPVRTLDGVWLCMRKKVWREFAFNTKELTGFHFYDIDISLRVSSKYKTAVVYDVELAHFSIGNYGDDWVLGAIDFHTRVNKIPVPCNVDGVIAPEWEQTVIRGWLRRLSIEKISFENKQRWVKVAGANEYSYILPFYFNYFKRFKVKLRRRFKLR